MIGLAASACHDAPALDARLSELEAVARGRVIFAKYCALCHGEQGDGHGVRARYLSKKPPDLTRAEGRRALTPAQVSATIRDGVPGTSMPAWRSLSDRDIAQLTAYVVSLREAP